jgi:hypothetical protein
VCYGEFGSLASVVAATQDPCITRGGDRVAFPIPKIHSQHSSTFKSPDPRHSPLRLALTPTRLLFFSHRLPKPSLPTILSSARVLNW